MATFRHSQGIVFAREWAMTDADATALGEVFRTEAIAAFNAKDDAAWERARSCLHALITAKQAAFTYRRARARAIRLDAFIAARNAA